MRAAALSDKVTDRLSAIAAIGLTGRLGAVDDSPFRRVFDSTFQQHNGRPSPSELERRQVEMLDRWKVHKNEYH